MATLLFGGACAGTQQVPPAASPVAPTAAPAAAPQARASEPSPASEPGIDVPAADKATFDALPPGHREALHQLARLRRRLHLPPWRFSAELTAAGAAHVRYHVTNCMAGRPPTGHFERPSDPGYSAEGDRAARSSGISFGAKTPVRALESFLSGPYHRAQFVARQSGRIGVASGGGEQRKSTRSPGRRVHHIVNCGVTLFPFEHDRVRRPRPQGPRFVRFPPDQATKVPTLFPGERPDPRPPGARPTGYPATIHLRPEDSKRLQGVRAVMRGPGGADVPLWLADPGRPAVKQPPMGIYGAGGVVASKKRDLILDAYARNFDQVMLMPHAPLKPNTRFEVDVELTIDGQTHRLRWWFQTRKQRPTALRSRATTRSYVRTRKASAPLAHLSPGWPGDVSKTRLAARVHALAPDTHIGRSMVIVGARGPLAGGPIMLTGSVGGSLVVKRAALVKDPSPPPNPEAPIVSDNGGHYGMILGDLSGKPVSITLSDLTLVARGRLLVLLPGASVHLRRVRLASSGRQAVTLLPGASLTLERCDVKGLSHPDAVHIGPRRRSSSVNDGPHTRLSLKSTTLPAAMLRVLRGQAKRRPDFQLHGQAAGARP